MSLLFSSYKMPEVVSVSKLELIVHPSEADFDRLYHDCLGSTEDMAYLNVFSYPGAWEASADELLEDMKELEHCYLLGMGESIVGLVNYGALVPWQPKAFGMLIGRKFAGRGYGKRALGLFLESVDSLGIEEVNGYCLAEHSAMIRVMEANGMQRDDQYRDAEETGSVRYFAE